MHLHNHHYLSHIVPISFCSLVLKSSQELKVASSKGSWSRSQLFKKRKKTIFHILPK
uniref:Uncharacterized protein n=1 Tax=Rhizophora mucronata TaxID=61149 RepID=A0A2P2PWJ0_RHIMU